MPFMSAAGHDSAAKEFAPAVHVNAGNYVCTVSRDRFGVPGGTFIVPTGANVTLSGLFAGFAANSSGLKTVNSGNITTTNPQSQYYIGFNGSGTLNVSAGGTVFSASQSYVGYNPGSSGVLTVADEGSMYTNAGFFIIGNSGPAQLSVTNGGAVSSSSGTADLQIKSNGTVTISGKTIVGAIAGTSSPEISSPGASGATSVFATPGELPLTAGLALSESRYGSL
ncbi:hypothetical protein [Paraburkholderia sp. MM6662-R1]|uniref:hypothetical protein n=1 Tax=Paraburkholderia sp. MM6662-R1 TaxID=2991066 RepID=UPI003D20BE9B